MMISVSSGRFTASQIDVIIRPRFLQAGKPPVVFCTGTGVTAVEANDLATKSGIRRVLRHLVGQGHVCVVPSATNLWGNSTGRARVASAITYAETNLGAAGPAILIGFSQGGVAALSYAMYNPTEVACVIGLVGAVDLNDIRDDDDAGQRDDIDAAYGVTYPAALPAGVNPAGRASEFTTIPTQWWYANNDSFIDTPTVTAFGAIANTDLHDVGALGHTDAAVLAVDLNDLDSFVNAST